MSSLLTRARPVAVPAPRDHSRRLWTSLLVLALSGLALLALAGREWLAPAVVLHLLVVPGCLAHRLLPRLGLPAAATVVAGSLTGLVLLSTAAAMLGLWSPVAGTAVVVLLCGAVATLDLWRHRAALPGLLSRRTPLPDDVGGFEAPSSHLNHRTAPSPHLNHRKPPPVEVRGAPATSLETTAANPATGAPDGFEAPSSHLNHRTAPSSHLNHRTGPSSHVDHRAAPSRAGWGLGAASLVLWLIALPLVAGAEPGPRGLLLDGPWPFGASLGIAVVAAVVALRTRDLRLLIVLIGLVCLIERGTAPLVLDAPMIDWSYKHLGAVALLSDLGGLDDGLDIYQDWPGFFAANAWLSEASGLSALTIAHWFTLAITCATAIAVHALARSFGLTREQALTATLLAVLVNWVAQDYYSPQALGYVLAILVLALVVGAGARGNQTGRAARLAAVPVFAALVVTHQLTPYWVLAAVAALVVLRRVPWWVLLALGAVAGAQLLVNLDVVSGYGLFTGTDVVANATSHAGEESGSPELRLHSLLNRVATLGLWGSAALVSLVVWWRQRWRRWFAGPELAAAALAFSPFVILLAQSYGGEAVLRVMLYSIPGCAVLVAPVLVSLVLRSTLGTAAATLALLGVTASAGHAYFSTWWHYAVTEAEYDTAVLLHDQVPGKAYFSPASAYWPVRASAGYAWRLRNDPEFDRPLQGEGEGVGSSTYLTELEAHLENRDSPTFALFNGRMDDYADYRGIAPDGTLDTLLTELEDRDGWETVLTDGPVTVLRWVPVGTENQPAARWAP